MYQNIFFDHDTYEMHLWDDTSGYSSFKYRKYAYIEDDNGTFVSLKGRKVKRTGRWSDADVQDGKVHEADINPEMRVLVDSYLERDDASKNHRELYIDIEVSMEEGIPNVIVAGNEITAISLYSRSNDKYVAIVLDKNNKINNSKNGKDNVKVMHVNTEEELLSKFYSLYTKINPTIITGWNIDFFDIPYLFNRTKIVLGEDSACLLSPIGVVKWIDYKKKYRIAGVSCLDYLSLYKNFTFSQEPTYNLDAIGIKELGFGKIKYEGTLDNLFATDIEKFIEYNINDVKIVKLIDDKLKFIDLAKGICHKGHVPYEDIFYPSKFLEGAMLVYMKKLNMVAPCKVDREDTESFEKFEGAYVKEPLSGRYDWVYDLDMTSLYPSVIMSLNISPETKVGKIEGWKPDDYFKNLDKTHTIYVGNKKSKIDNKELKQLLDEGKFSISSNGILYETQTKGIIPAIIETWFAERVEYRNLMKKYGDSGNTQMYEYFKSRQYIQKVLLNSLYGVLGLPVFRFYDLDNAEAVTITGQSVIQYSEKMANYYYNKELGTDKDYVIYVDTDSNYLSALPLIEHRYPKYDVKDETQMADYVIEIATDMQKFINSSFDLFGKKFLNISKHHFNIKQEMVAKCGIWITKKRYAMWAINDNGVKVDKLEVKGIDIVRADFPPAFRSFLKGIVKDILFKEKKEDIDKKILTFKKNIRILSLEQIAKPTTVKNVKKYTAKINKGQKHMTASSAGFRNYIKGSPVHVKASIMYNNLIDFYGLDKKYSKIEDSEKIRWVYLTQNEFDIDALAFKGYEDPVEVMNFLNKHVNYEKMFDSVLSEKVEDIYKALTWLLPSEAEKNLNQFFTI